MNQLILKLQSLLVAGWDVVISLLAFLVPWTPLLAWVAFWLLAVNWVKLRETLIQGGWIGVALIGFMMVLVWGVVAPPNDGTHHLFGLHVSNFVGKIVYVTTLLTIMFLCGSVQLSGGCGSLANFPPDACEDEHGHAADHGHSDHGHGTAAHDSHGHNDAHADHENTHSLGGSH